MLLAAVILSPHSAQGKAPISAEQIVDLRVASDVQLSPDGRQIAFVVSEPALPDAPLKPRETNIWFVAADGMSREHVMEHRSGTDRSPRWSPDGRMLAFLSAREPPGTGRPVPQIYLQLASGGAPERLTNASGEIEQFRWSGDSKAIAFVVNEPPIARGENGIPGDDAAVVDDDSHERLWVVTIGERRAIPVTKEELDIHDFAWSPDGGHFALQLRDSNPLGRLTLVVIRRSDGALLRTLTKEVGDSGSLEWSPDGRMISFFAATPRRIPCWLGVVPAEGGTPRLLLKDYPGTIVNATWSRDSKYLLAEMMAGTRQALLRIDVASETFHPVADLRNMPEFNFSFSSNGTTTAYLNQTSASPNEVWTIGPNMSPRKLTDLNPYVNSWETGNVREVAWMSTTDKSNLKGVLITPPHFQEGHQYPTVVQTHPGWIAWWEGWQGSWWAWGQFLATHGYVVFLPNYRGVWGQGWKWFDALADWGGLSIRDLNDGVDYLVQQKIADPNSVGIGGWSNGGFVAAAAITQTTRFKAAVLDAPVTDFYSCQGLPSCAFLRVHLLDNPYEQRGKYDEHSPMTLVRNCRTPTLLLHGEQDEAVPIGQSYEFYYALKNLGVETKMVVYPREQHSIEERGHQLDLENRVLAWFDSHLKKE